MYTPASIGKQINDIYLFKLFAFIYPLTVLFISRASYLIEIFPSFCVKSKVIVLEPVILDTDFPLCFHLQHWYISIVLNRLL